AGVRVDDTLQRAVREQRQERYLVPAVVLRPAQGTLAGGAAAADKSAGPQTPQRTRILASWTAPDGSSHQGTVPAAEEPPRPGDRFRIWTDTSGRLVGQPLAASAAAFHSVMAGMAAALGVAALVETVRRLIVRRLVHRRYLRLDRAWAAVGPDWGRAGAGS
ncbi:Rv1733c family protein, partial [Streptomyces sp. NPDC054838]